MSLPILDARELKTKLLTQAYEDDYIDFIFFWCRQDNRYNYDSNEVSKID